MTAGMTRPDIIGYTRCACRPQYDATTHLRDGSARTPMKVVTSDDTPRGGARMPYIRGLLNGTSLILRDHSRCEREPPELKHLSRGRKRNQ